MNNSNFIMEQELPFNNFWQESYLIDVEPHNKTMSTTKRKFREDHRLIPSDVSDTRYSRYLQKFYSMYMVLFIPDLFPTKFENLNFTQNALEHLWRIQFPNFFNLIASPLFRCRLYVFKWKCFTHKHYYLVFFFCDVKLFICKII